MRPWCGRITRPPPAPGLLWRYPDPSVAAFLLGNPKHLPGCSLRLCFSLDHTGAGEHGHTRSHTEACTLSFRLPVILNKNKKRACVGVTRPRRVTWLVRGPSRTGQSRPLQPKHPGFTSCQGEAHASALVPPADGRWSGLGAGNSPPAVGCQDRWQHHWAASSIGCGSPALHPSLSPFLLTEAEDNSV